MAELRTLRSRGARLLRALLLALTFSVSLVFGVLLHSNLPVMRKLAAVSLVSALDDVFYGQIRVGSFERITLTQIVASDFEVLDEHGVSILKGKQLSVHLDLPSLLMSLLFDGEALNVVIPHLRLEQGQVQILFDKGVSDPTIVRAFTPKPTPKTEPSGPKRALLLWFSNIEIGQALGRIDLGNEQFLEARATHAQGRVLVSPNQVAIDVDRVALGLAGMGEHEVKGTGTASLLLPGAITLDFHGFFHDLEFQLHARQREDRISAELDVPETAPSAIAALIPAWPLKVPASLHAEAQGNWSKLATSFDLQFSRATIDADGTIVLEPSLAASFQIFAHDLDLRAIAPEAPETAITLNAAIEAQKTSEAIVAKFSAQTEPTAILGQPVPRIDIAGSFDQQGLNAEARIFEPNAPMSAQLSVKGSNLALEAKIPEVTLDNWPRIPKLFGGTASIALQAKLEKNQLTASLNAKLRNITNPQFQLRQATLQARASGDIEHLEQLYLHATLDGVDLTRGQLAFAKVLLEVDGRWREPHLDLALTDYKDRRLKLQGEVAILPHLRLHDLEFELLDRNLALRGKIFELDPEAESIDVREISMSGEAGSLTGYLRYKPGLLETELNGEQLELTRIALALGFTPSSARGKARIHLELVAGSDVTRGNASLVLERASIAGFGSTTLRVQAALHENAFSGDLSGIDPLLGSFAAQWNGTLAGTIFESRAWRDATGSAEFRSDGIPLTPLQLALGSKSPLKDLEGQAFARVLLQRTAADNPPNLSAEVGASNLGFRIEAASGEGYGLRNANLLTNLGLNAKSGDLTAALMLGDPSGDLLTASGAMRLDLDRLLEKPSDAWPILREIPLDIVISLPPRELRELPPPLQVTALRGTVSARVSVRGSIEKPTLSATVLGTQIGAASSSLAEALNAKAQLDYSPLSSKLNAQVVLNNANGQVADLRLDANVPWTANADSSELKPSGRIDAVLRDLPLTTVSVLADNGIQGKLDGSIHASFASGKVDTRADLIPKDLYVGRTSLGGGALTLIGNMDQVTGQLRLSSPASSIVANLQIAAPQMKRLDSLALDLEAHKLEAGLLGPLLTGIVSGPTGQLDAHAAFQLTRNSKGKSEEWESRLNGTAELKNGMAHIEALGLELRDVGWSASARSTGSDSLISFSQLRAKARSAKPNITGSANLNLRGISIVSGSAALHLNDVPLTMQGVPKGWGTGGVSATLTRQPDRMLIEVDIPEFLTRLPQSTGRDLIDLKDNPDFNVLQLETTIAGEPGVPWQIVIHLGDRVRVTRSDVNISVTGRPTIDITDQSRLSGNIELTPGGRVQAIGKVFQIEHGSVRLNPEDPENPLVDIRASWRDPEGANLYIGVHGMLKDLDELEFGSDAGLSKEEIWERLVGVANSTASNSKDSQDPNSDSAVGQVGAAGIGAAALGLNELFGGSLRDVEIRLDPGENASYTAAVRLSDKLWLEGSYQHNDTTITFGEPSNVVTGALDYRFMRNWSLRTELGNAGGTVDLLWQRRY